MDFPTDNQPMNRKKLLEMPRFIVERREYDDGDALPIVRDVVVHPGAVVILPILEAGRIVMIRNIRQAAGERLWELPAGTREPGEPELETAGRELIEETGYRAGSIEPLAEFFTSPGILSELMHAFVATDLTYVGQQLEHGERIDVEPVEADRLRRMMRDGVIRDGKTLAVLGLYFLGR